MKNDTYIRSRIYLTFSSLNPANAMATVDKFSLCFSHFSDRSNDCKAARISKLKTATAAALSYWP